MIILPIQKPSCTGAPQFWNALSDFFALASAVCLSARSTVRPFSCTEHHRNRGNPLEKQVPPNLLTGDLAELPGNPADLASEDLDDLDAIHQMGEGWVGDEALAIAVYCALKYSGDIDGALIAAVNHNGDSDSTGAITGNIIGAQVGLSGIPAKYTEKLELRNLIIELAGDLWHDCRISEYGDERDPIWEQKYIEMRYGKRP